MERRIAITGVGLLTSAGHSPAQLQERLCAGSPVYEHFRLAPDTETNLLSGRNIRPLDRISRLTTAVAQLALDDSGWTPEARGTHELGMVLGTMYCGARTIGEFDRRALQKGPGGTSPMDFANTVMNAAAGQAAVWHKLRGPNVTLVGGTASGLQAIAYAADAIRAGRSHALLAGGVEDLSPEALFAFEKSGLALPASRNGPAGAVPFDEDRAGFVPGEAGALVMLEDMNHARLRGARILGEVRGYAGGWDRTGAAEPDRSSAAGVRCVSRAVTSSGIDPAKIGFVMASANGSRYGDRHEAVSVAAALNGAFHTLPVSAIKSVLGETVGASGPLQLVAALETFRSSELAGAAGLRRLGADIPLRNISPETRKVTATSALINAFSFDGTLCSMVIGSV